MAETAELHTKMNGLEAYINGQTQFRKVETFVNGYSVDAAKGEQYYYMSGRNHKIKDVAIPGEMQIQADTTNVDYNYHYEYNIYFEFID